MIILKLIGESLKMAIDALVLNKVRTILSLTGITIGIFSIISVFTVFDSLENSIKSEINSLGNDILFIQKWPWAMGGDYPWWKYFQRPEPKLSELKQIMQRSNTVGSSAFMFSVNRNVYYGKNIVEDVRIAAISHGYNQVFDFDIGLGRYFTEQESVSGRNVAILGYDIAKNLFQNEDPIGKRIKVLNRRLFVIGVISKKGDDIFGNSPDKMIFIPVKFVSTLIDTRKISSSIVIKSKKGIPLES